MQRAVRRRRRRCSMLSMLNVVVTLIAVDLRVRRIDARGVPAVAVMAYRALFTTLDIALSASETTAAWTYLVCE